ncbi:MAG: GNAT family N-acetyltransferase [Bacteroides sp.]|nr:GNAT family N-acetyltransferase [Bacteroides sp.]
MLTIRKATIEDCELIHKMAHVVFPATYKELLSQGQMDFMMDWMYSLPNLRKQMEEGHVYFIGYKEGEPFGYISVQQEEEDLFHLQKIYVLPEFQGIKGGDFLFNHAVEYIKSVHPAPCRMILNVNRYNKAVTYYLKKGMKKVGEGDFHIGHGYYMTDYIMGLDIC